MTDGASYRARFTVRVVLEPEADGPIADIGYRGQFASAMQEDGDLVLVLYDREGDGDRRMPLLGLIDALQDTARRLGGGQADLESAPGITEGRR